MDAALSTSQLAFLRLTKKSACLLLALHCLGRPAGARELAYLLDISEKTVGKYLVELASLNLVTRLKFQQGFVLTRDFGSLLGDGETSKIYQFQPTITTTIGKRTAIEAEIVVDPAETGKNYQFRRQTGKNYQFRSSREKGNKFNPQSDSEEPGDPEVVLALQQAGIGQPKRSLLARLPHMTAGYVRAWESFLKAEKGERYTPGLLIHVIQSGDPAPPTNEYGHYDGCRCRQCDPYWIGTCPDCFTYPCECGLADEAEGEQEECEEENL